jgi:hypothetical protein
MPVSCSQYTDRTGKLWRVAYCLCDSFELGYWEGLDLRVSIFFAHWEEGDVTGDMLDL